MKLDDVCHGPCIMMAIAKVWCVLVYERISLDGNSINVQGCAALARALVHVPALVTLGYVSAAACVWLSLCMLRRAAECVCSVRSCVKLWLALHLGLWIDSECNSGAVEWYYVCVTPQAWLQRHRSRRLH